MLYTLTASSILQNNNNRPVCRTWQIPPMRWLVANFTIGEVGRHWSVAWKGINDFGWSTKKIFERIS